MDFRVWLVLAEEARCRRWQRLLQKSGWPVVPVADAGALLREAGGAVGLALVDASALGARPAAALRELKDKVRSLPLIMTSAGPMPDDAVVAAFEAGADDYFPDSMDDRLVLARLNAHLRRLLPQVASALDTILAPGGDIKLDRASRNVWVKVGAERWAVAPPLTPTETLMLSLFLEHPGMVLERRFLLETVWQEEAEIVQPGTVDKHVESLRRKLGAKGKRIRTVYGSGYLFKDGEP